MPMQQPQSKFKLKNEFKVHDFLLLVNTDYLFAKKNTNEFYLLNVQEFGKLSEEDVEKLINAGKKVLVIDTETNEMSVYNIEEQSVATAMLSM